VQKVPTFYAIVDNSSLFDEFVCKLGQKAQFTQERVEYNVFLFDEPLKGFKSLKTFKISLTFRFDNLWHVPKSSHIGENSQILTVSNKKKK
jgi:flagellar assembly factor FliW